MAQHNRIGKVGERKAKRYLEEKGYQILATNWRFQRAEIDIIAVIGNILVVVEVKTRSSDFSGDPSEAVTKSKQKLLIKATSAYIEEKDLNQEIRFDIISILNDEITHLEDAFYPLL